MSAREIASAVGAVLFIATAVLAYQWGSTTSGQRPQAVRSASPSASRQPSTADIYAAVAPSVVSIDATRPAPSRLRLRPASSSTRTRPS
jgi:S1-C subfamily serine protease